MSLFKTTLATHQTVINLKNIDWMALNGSGNTITICFFDAPDETLKYKSREDAESEFKEMVK